MVSDFKNITVVGLGMIGGSIIKALKSKSYMGNVYGIDNNENSILEAFNEGLILNCKSEEARINESDLVILATPIGKFHSLLESIVGDLKKGCIVTDVGSVKNSVHIVANQILKDTQTFIGGHPMIGSEKSGFSASKAHLFENAYYFLTSENGQTDELLKLKSFVEKIGAKVCLTEPKKHDYIVARTSHIPHLSAALLVNLLDKEEMLIDYVGGGFRDTTRIASGSPEMWSEILLNNKTEVVDAIDGLVQQLEQFKKNLLEEKQSQIVYNLSKAKSLREKIPKHLMDSIEQEFAIYIDVQDKPGMIASVSGLMAENNINIKDIEILHARETMPGVLKVGFYSLVESNNAQKLLLDSEFGKIHTIKNGSDIN